MCRRLIVLALVALVLSVVATSAQAATVISNVTHRNTDTDATEDPQIGPNPLADDELFFNDRTHIYAEVPAFLIGADYVLLANDNKNWSAYELDITFSKSATLYVFVDNRMGGSAGGLGVDPIITGMSWLTDLGFIDTDEDVGIDESADGSINQYLSIFALDVSKGTVTLGGCTEGNAGNMYGVAAILRISDPIAQLPVPEDGAFDVIRDSQLTWTSGLAGQTHNVYFGETFADVNSATEPTSSQGVNEFDPGRLAFSTTYYWRVDEVNGTPDKTVFKGGVWSFETEPLAIPVENVIATASTSSAGSGPETTVNGAGLNTNAGTHSTVATDMWLSGKDQAADEPVFVQYEFDQAYNLQEVRVWNANQAMENILGFGFQDTIISYSTDGLEWTRLGGQEGLVKLAQAPGNIDYTGQLVSLGNIVAKYVKLTAVSNWSQFFKQYSLSEVRFYAVPTVARTPNPASGTQGVDPRNTVLSWRSGRDAGQHDVFVSPEADALGEAHTVSTNSIALSSLDLSLDTTYYWQVNEVNELLVPTTWAGDLWNFTAVSSFVVDDFESYTNLSPDRPFQWWVDGYGYTTPAPGNPGNNTGSGVGHDIWNTTAPTLMETTSTFSGSGQAMPVYYNNSGANGKLTYSQVDFAVGGQDWTVNGLQTLSIAFRGQAGNTGTLYAKINNTKILYDLVATNIAMPSWQVWNIDLAKVNVSLKNVQTLSIGVDGASASGMILIDDIGLYARPGELITPVAPDTAGLLAKYTFEGNAKDSSGNGLNGTLSASLAQVAAPGAAGQGSGVVLSLGGYVDLGNPTALDFGTGDWTVTAWFKTGMTGTGDANKGTIVGKGGDNAGGHRYALILSETYEGVVSLICDDNVLKIETHSSSVVNDDQWHSVVGLREGTEIRIYIDGHLEATSTADPAYSLAGTSQYDAYVGALTNAATGDLYKMFIGSIDEVGLYNRALSEGEILWFAGSTAPIHKPF